MSEAAEGPDRLGDWKGNGENAAEPTTLRHQVGSLPAAVLATWRTRYVTIDGIDLQTRAILNAEAAAMRAEGQQPDARTVWLRLIERLLRLAEPPPELVAATALAGLASGLRPQGFEPPSPAAAPGASVD